MAPRNIHAAPDNVRPLLSSRSLDDAAIAFHVTITGACAPLVGQTARPALVFEFLHQDTTRLAPIVLVLDDAHMDALPGYLAAEVAAALAKTLNVRDLT